MHRTRNGEDVDGLVDAGAQHQLGFGGARLQAHEAFIGQSERMLARLSSPLPRLPRGRSGKRVPNAALEPRTTGERRDASEDAGGVIFTLEHSLSATLKNVHAGPSLPGGLRNGLAPKIRFKN